MIVVVLSVASGCRQESPTSASSGSSMKVIATLFPLYDMARAIGGSKAEVRLLLPPGVEPHNFEPRPDDIISIQKAALFIYTNRFMEPWVEKLITGVGSKQLTVVDASAGLRLRPAESVARHDQGHKEEDDHDGHHTGGMDPHLWLDLDNAAKMVDLILAGFVVRDPANRNYYEANARTYKIRLKDIDRRYFATLARCDSRILLQGGHYAFGYLARRYGLEYLAATGVSADSETTPARMAELVRQVRTVGIKTIFTEELVSPRVAETIAEETGAGIMRLHAGHNISREELARGVTFPDLMEQNLDALAKGLQCRQ